MYKNAIKQIEKKLENENVGTGFRIGAEFCLELLKKEQEAYEKEQEREERIWEEFNS